MEMETIIRELSETLINELALRDECEYEKEMKNSFISLLLAVQNRRRQFHIEKKKSSKNGAAGQAAAAGRQNASGEWMMGISIRNAIEWVFGCPNSIARGKETNVCVMYSIIVLFFAA